MDVDLAVSFKAVAGKIDQGGGPVWRYKDAKNYYIARVNPLEDNYRLYKVVDGERIQFAPLTLKPRPRNGTACASSKRAVKSSAI